MGPDVDLEVMAKATPGMSGADLANLVNEAALFAVRRGSQADRADRLRERPRPRRAGRPPREPGAHRPRRSGPPPIHEGGHAMLATVLPARRPAAQGHDPAARHGPRRHVEPAARSATRTRRSTSRTSICKAMGGRVAEKIVFGHLNSGAANDLEQATGIARRMVREWGMSDARRPDGLEQPAAGVPRRGPDDPAAASTATTPPS